MSVADRCRLSPIGSPRSSSSPTWKPWEESSTEICGLGTIPRGVSTVTDEPVGGADVAA